MITLLGGACGGDDGAVTSPPDPADRDAGATTGEATTGEASSGPAGAAPVGTATLGSPLTLAGEGEGVEVEVTPLQVVDPAPHDGVFPPEGRYVAVQLRLRNVGSQPYELGTLAEALLDESGERFVPSPFTSDAGPSFPLLNPIPPGGEEVAFVTFDISSGSTPSRMQFTTDNGFGPETGEWTL